MLAAHVTHLGWDIAAAAFEYPVQLMHDVVATLVAIPDLAEADVETLQAGDADAAGMVAVVAPGTGLGFAFGSGAKACASEAGT